MGYHPFEPTMTPSTRFILLNTSHAGNVGATARAMKVMGFSDLVLVAPRWANVLRRDETIQRASGALDVLANAKIVDTLDEAIDGLHHLCATAMTPRDFGPPTSNPRAWLSGLPERLAADHGPAMANALQGMPGVGFLFGSERFGMRNEDVYRCHVALQIPTNPQFGSLNLGAAVQVIAYEWRMALGGFSNNPDPESSVAGPQAMADAAAITGALQHWEQALIALDFLDPASPKKLLPRLNQLLNRYPLQNDEIQILRGIAKAILVQSANNIKSR